LKVFERARENFSQKVFPQSPIQKTNPTETKTVKIPYDLHIHTALSACADNDMTPNNIVNMAALKGLRCIAATDHNSCLNCSAVMQLAQKRDILCLPGMELETSEGIHVICLFNTLSGAEAFSDYVYKNLPPVKNKPHIYGDQVVINKHDNPVREIETLLSVSSSISVENIVPMTAGYGGICYPAHIDRPANGILGILGVMHSDLKFRAFEVSARAPEGFSASHAYFENYNKIYSSDAHYLGDVSEPVNFLEAPELSADAVLRAINNV
jgi:PHP family Zn ribbon phosphoesterase